MISELEHLVIVGALVFIGIGLALCTVRAVRGPTLFDRILAFDCIVLNMVAAALLLSTLLGTSVFMDVVLVVALLGFLGTTSMAAYLEGSLVD